MFRFTLLTVCLMIGVMFAHATNQIVNQVMIQVQKENITPMVKDQILATMAINELAYDPAKAIKVANKIKSPLVKKVVLLNFADYLFDNKKFDDWAEQYIENNWETTLTDLAVCQVKNNWDDGCFSDSSVIRQRAKIAMITLRYRDYEAERAFNRILNDSNNLDFELEDQVYLLTVAAILKHEKFDALIKDCESKVEQDSKSKFLFVNKPELQLLRLAIANGFNRCTHLPEPLGQQMPYTFDSEHIQKLINFCKQSKDLDLIKQANQILANTKAELAKIDNIEGIYAGLDSVELFQTVDPEFATIISKKISELKTKPKLGYQDLDRLDFLNLYIDVIYQQKPATNLRQILFDMNQNTVKQLLPKICQLFTVLKNDKISDVESNYSIIYTFITNQLDNDTKMSLIFSLKKINDDYFKDLINGQITNENIAKLNYDETDILKDLLFYTTDDQRNHFIKKMISDIKNTPPNSFLGKDFGFLMLIIDTRLLLYQP